MAALHMLWMGLVLLGLLGFPQTRAEGESHGSVQPNFQQDKRTLAHMSHTVFMVSKHKPPISPRHLGHAQAQINTSKSQNDCALAITDCPFLGRWYSAGLASNSSWFREKKTVLFMCKTVVAPSTDGSLNLTSTFLRKNQCETKIMLLQPSAVPGQYNYNSPHWGSIHSISVVETNYDEYALLFSRGTKGPGQDFHMATLYSRTQTLKDKVKEKFTTFSKALGFTEEDIVFLPPPDKCIQE